MSYLSPFSMRRIIKYAVNARTVIATEIMSWNSIRLRISKSRFFQLSPSIEKNSTAYKQGNSKNELKHFYPPNHLRKISITAIAPRILTAAAAKLTIRSANGGRLPVSFNNRIISSSLSKNAFSSTPTNINQFRTVFKGYFSGLAFGGLPRLDASNLSKAAAGYKSSLIIGSNSLRDNQFSTAARDFFDFSIISVTVTPVMVTIHKFSENVQKKLVFLSLLLDKLFNDS